ncbi:MAG TPA: hypothetical protein ENK06_01695 [Gammaproteobacteria bacterium]|nr:hypothetical protein [Gammaproteobacteria bacterium]
MIVSNKHPAIAKEGWLVIGIVAGLLFVSIFLSSALFALFGSFLVFLLYVYRDPARKIPSAPLGIVSPADGRIVSIARVENKYTNAPSYRIAIKKNKMGVFAIRCPIEGKLHKQLQEKASGVYRYIDWVQTDEGDNILWDSEVRSPTIAHCYVQSGERIGHGQRCGFLLFNSHVNLCIPINSSLNVKVHDTVRAGESIIAHLFHNQGASIVASAQDVE